MKKIAYGITILALIGFTYVMLAQAAPNTVFQVNVLPQTNQTYDLGSTTPAREWKNVYTQNLTVSGTCTGCGGSTVGQTWEIGGNSITGFLAPTTTQRVWIGQASSTLFSSFGPAYFGATATSSFSSAGVLTLITPLLVGSGGTGQTTFTSGQLLYGNGTAALSSVATSSLAIGASLSNTGTLGSQVGGSASVLSLNTANANTWTAAQLFSYTATTSFSGGLYGSLISSPYFHATSTTATSTFSGNARVMGNLQVDGNFFAPVTLVASGNVKIDGTLQVVGAVDLDTFTSAILLTGAGGDIAEYAGTSCTNQFIRSLSALGAATCASINNDDWSGADLSVANGGTGVSTFTSSQLLYGNSTTALSSVATTSLSIGLGLSHSATLGAFVGGSAGTLTIATSSLYAGTTGLFPYFSGTNALTATSSLFLAASGNIGIGSTTPAHLFSVGAFGSHFAVNSSGTIMSAASQPATSTAITLNWATTPNSVEYRLGGAATTITLINATTSTMWGSRKLIQLWNPSGAAGAVTFVGVEFSSAYTQTTAANKGDFISCVVSLATSTTAYKVLCTAGAASQ